MERSYRAPWWLPGGHAQTIWPALFAKRFEGAAPGFERERWTTPDGDLPVDGRPTAAPHPERDDRPPRAVTTGEEQWLS